MEGGRLQRDNPAGPGDGDAAVAALSSVPSVLGSTAAPCAGIFILLSVVFPPSPAFPEPFSLPGLLRAPP